MCLQVEKADLPDGNNHNDDDDLCIVCWENLREVIFCHCMHMVRSRILCHSTLPPYLAMVVSTCHYMSTLHHCAQGMPTSYKCCKSLTCLRALLAWHA